MSSENRILLIDDIILTGFYLVSVIILDLTQYLGYIQYSSRTVSITFYSMYLAHSWMLGSEIKLKRWYQLVFLNYCFQICWKSTFQTIWISSATTFRFIECLSWFRYPDDVSYIWQSWHMLRLDSSIDQVDYFYNFFSQHPFQNLVMLIR